MDSEGIGVEMEKLAAKMGGTIKWPYNESECLDADFFKIVADHLVTEAGIRPYLHSLATEVIMEGHVIKGVISESKSGRNAILAKRVIDCTGDADIAHLTGAPYRKSAKEEMMGVTPCLTAQASIKKNFCNTPGKIPPHMLIGAKPGIRKPQAKKMICRAHI